MTAWREKKRTATPARPFRTSAPISGSPSPYLGDPRPAIVCLCGSTRFMEAFFAAGWELTLRGHIVLSVGVCPNAADHGAEALGPDVATALDELHLRKIDLADWVLILNVGGYVGESTAAEWRYADERGKIIGLFTNGPRRAAPPPPDERPSWDEIAKTTRQIAEVVEANL